MVVDLTGIANQAHFERVHLLAARLDDVQRADIDFVAVRVRQRRRLTERLDVDVVFKVTVQEIRQLGQIVDGVFGFTGKLVPVRLALPQYIINLRRNRRPESSVSRLDGFHVRLEHGGLVHFGHSDIRRRMISDDKLII